MQRCRQCEATMTPTEKECLTCGAKIVEVPKSDARTKFRTLIKYLALFAGAMAIASLFIDTGVSFTTCATVTVVLGLALNSAQDMLIDREK